MSDIAANLADVKTRIGAACEKSGRSVDEITLIAVSKTFSATDVHHAYEAGQLHFGENKQQEAEGKIPLCPSSLDWHFIGQLQRNKVRKVLPMFSMIHSIDSLRLASYTNDVAQELDLLPKVFLQVNLAGELSKGGFSPEELWASWHTLMGLNRLKIQGLMTVPPAADQPEHSRHWFAGMKKLRDALQVQTGALLPSLSMGMSGDYSIAIEEGATHIRVGAAIFGGRDYGATNAP